MKIWAIIAMYLGIGTILGAVILLASRNFNTAMGIGGAIALIGVGMYAYCVWRTLQAQRGVDRVENAEHKVD